ncbi:hypothetical protein GCM10010517_25190 [Streptosporangium fragile]|uniref:Uncharacterized protein n=1 Tax=Streptosporangium fragile TaxID=46186 RepID=A0ABN3VVY8_9ACTN
MPVTRGRFDFSARYCREAGGRPTSFGLGLPAMSPAVIPSPPEGVCYLGPLPIRASTLCSCSVSW